MGLAEKLNKALTTNNLQAKLPEHNPDIKHELAEEPEVPQEIEEVIEEINIPEKLESGSNFNTLTEAVQNADSFEPDEFGTRLLLVNKIDLEDIKLPLQSGKYIIDDIQKRKNGIYEIHLVEND